MQKYTVLSTKHLPFIEHKKYTYGDLVAVHQTSHFTRFGHETHNFRTFLTISHHKHSISCFPEWPSGYCDYTWKRPNKANSLLWATF